MTLQVMENKMTDVRNAKANLVIFSENQRMTKEVFVLIENPCSCRLIFKK